MRFTVRRRVPGRVTVDLAYDKAASIPLILLPERASEADREFVKAWMSRVPTAGIGRGRP